MKMSELFLIASFIIIAAMKSAYAQDLPNKLNFQSQESAFTSHSREQHRVENNFHAVKDQDSLGSVLKLNE